MDDKTLKQQNPALYHIAREGATEAPFVGKYVNEKTAGVYHCAVCEAPLFSSLTKFDSGSGWPSFTDPALSDAVTLHEDTSHGVVRTEVRCATCDAHLGHIFPDGPQHGAKICDRYCINSLSLDLKPDRSKNDFDNSAAATGTGDKSNQKETNSENFFDKFFGDAGGDGSGDGGGD